MKTLLKSVIAAAALSVPSMALASTFDIDPAHTTAQFTVKYMMMTNVRGEFGKVAGTINLDDKDITKSTVSVEIDPASVDTRQEKRDAHLKSPDFFDVEKFKQLTFKSTKVEKAGAGKLKVTGDLTIHGVTKPVVLDVSGPTPEAKDPFGNTRTSVSATTKLNRKDFGLNWNKPLEQAGGVLVGDEVEVNLDVSAIKQAAAPATAPAAKAVK